VWADKLQTGVVADRLTSYLERGMATNGLAHSVLGHAPVLAAVLLLFALHRPVEEEGPVLELDAVRFLFVGADGFAILETGAERGKRVTIW